MLNETLFDFVIEPSVPSVISTPISATSNYVPKSTLPSKECCFSQNKIEVIEIQATPPKSRKRRLMTPSPSPPPVKKPLPNVQLAISVHQGQPMLRHAWSKGRSGKMLKKTKYNTFFTPLSQEHPLANSKGSQSWQHAIKALRVVKTTGEDTTPTTSQLFPEKSMTPPYPPLP